MPLELRPLSSLFPDIDSVEFDALKASIAEIDGVRDDRRAMFSANPRDDRFWFVSHVDLQTHEQTTMPRGIREDGVVAFLDFCDDRYRYSFVYTLKPA